MNIIRVPSEKIQKHFTHVVYVRKYLIEDYYISETRSTLHYARIHTLTIYQFYPLFLNCIAQFGELLNVHVSMNQLFSW